MTSRRLTVRQIASRRVGCDRIRRFVIVPMKRRSLIQAVRDAHFDRRDAGQVIITRLENLRDNLAKLAQQDEVFALGNVSVSLGMAAISIQAKCRCGNCFGGAVSAPVSGQQG